jgi:hypothetical protein
MKLKVSKSIIFLVCLGICSLSVHSFELGLIGGTQSNPSNTVYGLSMGSGFLIPMVKLEIEGIKLGDSGYKMLTGGIKFRPRLGIISPYAIVGAGSEFDSFSFSFSQYNNFTFFGVGAHVHLMYLVSLRGDIRFFNYSDYNRTRFTAGIFVHL